MLEQSFAGFYGTLSARGITPSVHLPEEKVIRPLDAAALRRVFDNILSNAAKYSDGDLTVTLSPDGKVTFSNRACSTAFTPSILPAAPPDSACRLQNS